jgi:hypothetical protein
LVLALTLAAILGFQRLYYGDALPNTYYLKLTGTPLHLMIVNGLRQHAVYLERSALAVATTVAALLTWQRQDRRLWLFAGIVFGVMAYDIRAGGDWIVDYTSRFFAPVLPLLIIACAGATVHVFARLVSWPDRSAGAPATGELSRFQSILCVALGVIACAQFNSPLALREWFDPSREPMYLSINAVHVRLARYLTLHTDEDTTVAVHYAGLPAYFLDRPMIDVLGKNDTYIAHQVVSNFEPGHSKWDWSYILEGRRADIMDSQDRSRGLDRREDFRNLYMRVTAASAGFLMRKESLGKLHDPEAALSVIAAR